VLAHRGGRGPWRENTLEAFAGALASGADGVELDVRISADGVAVVHHDARIEDLGPVSATTSAELPSWLPTLDAALVACDRGYVNVELKLDGDAAGTGAAGALAAAVAPVLAGAPAALAGVVVSSFWPEALEALAALAPALPRALLVHPALDAAGALPLAAGLGCAALHPHIGAVTPALVSEARASGLAVTTWTVNEAPDLDRALAAGVDGVVTDDVAGAVTRCRGAGAEVGEAPGAG
jgi:glycerophosphoryl diester phosphodiesterase